MRRVAGVVPGLLALTLVLAGCGSTSDPGPPAPAAPAGAATDPAGSVSEALSTPAQDTVYPDVGQPGIDALHYGLGLSWDAEHATLTGNEALQFRATRTAPQFQLDLAHQLTVGKVWLDGRAVPFTHPAKNLIVDAPVTAGDRHLLQLTYSGTPEPVVAPTDRADFDTTGWTTTRDRSVWTMQEPYGAYSWYAVNDHPSDKALLRLHDPGPRVDGGRRQR